MNERTTILLLAIIMAALLLSGCFFNPLKPGKNDPFSSQNTQTQRPAGEPLELSAFSHSSSSMSMESCYSYSLVQEADGIHFYADLYAGQHTIDTVIDEPALEKLGAIAGKYHLAEWDGFHKSDSSILDGSMFSLSMTLKDGKEINAHGSNSFPPNYGDARMEICAVFDELVDKYGNLYPKTLESDALDSIMLNIKPKDSFHQTFSILAYPTGDDMVKIELHFVEIPEYGPDEYSFFGHSKTFPFEEIQSIIRKYDVPSWNGWDETAEDYDKAEWFQLNLGYESDEHISAMGTLYPDGYDDFRKEIMELVIDFVRENGDTFIPWQG